MSADFSVAHLRVFVDSPPDAICLSSRRAADLRAAVTAVLEANTIVEDADVRTIDVAAVGGRFVAAARAAGRLTDNTVHTYLSAFHRALRAFTGFMTDNPHWHATPRTRLPYGANAVRYPARMNRTYRFPLRPDTIITFTLPVELTADEAHRLTQFIGSLVV